MKNPIPPSEFERLLVEEARKVVGEINGKSVSDLERQWLKLKTIKDNPAINKFVFEKYMDAIKADEEWRVHAACPAEHLVEAHFLVCPGERVYEYEAVALPHTLGRQMFGARDVEEVAFEIRFDLGLPRGLDLTDGDGVDRNGNRLRIAEIDLPIQSDHVECCMGSSHCPLPRDLLLH